MRPLAALLLVANLLFFGWSRGWLDGVAGVRAQGDREPERLAQQIRPEAVRVLMPDEAARVAEAAAAAQTAAASAAAVAASGSAPAAASGGALGTAAASGGSPGTVTAPPTRPAASAASAPLTRSAASGVTVVGAASTAATKATPTVATTAARSDTTAATTTTAATNATAVTSTAAGIACLEAGPFDDATFATAQVSLRQALPTVRWADVRTDSGGAWIVYMGKYASREVQAKKEQELNHIHIAFQEVNVPPELGPGLSLGRFDSRAAAETALAQFTRHGIRTARVVELQPALPAHLLRVEPLDAQQAARLVALPAAGNGRRFAACRAG